MCVCGGGQALWRKVDIRFFLSHKNFHFHNNSNDKRIADVLEIDIWNYFSTSDLLRPLFKVKNMPVLKNYEKKISLKLCL